jgi:hypothetical protein
MIHARARWPAPPQFEGKKLTEIINTEHENKKYLPGVKLPENVVAIPDIGEAVKGATALVFVMPHQCEWCLPAASHGHTSLDGDRDGSVPHSVAPCRATMLLYFAAILTD